MSLLDIGIQPLKPVLLKIKHGNNAEAEVEIFPLSLNAVESLFREHESTVRDIIAESTSDNPDDLNVPEVDQEYIVNLLHDNPNFMYDLVCLATKTPVKEGREFAKAIHVKSQMDIINASLEMTVGTTEEGAAVKKP